MLTRDLTVKQIVILLGLMLVPLLAFVAGGAAYMKLYPYAQALPPTEGVIGQVAGAFNDLKYFEEGDTINLRLMLRARLDWRMSQLELWSRSASPADKAAIDRFLGWVEAERTRLRKAGKNI